MENLAELNTLEDEELVRRSRQEPARAELYLGLLYERCYPKVAAWCLRVCGSRQEAADLAQEVFLKVHTGLDSYRHEARFSTWLYTVTRRVAIDRGRADRRRDYHHVAEEAVPESADDSEPVDEHVSRGQVLERLREVMERDLEPLEARVVYLHYVDGLTLPAITEFLALDNKSGAKAYLVGGMRKLRRRFGPWLQRHLLA